MTLRRPAQGFDDVPVAQLDESGAVLRVWPSRGDASEATVNALSGAMAAAFSLGQCVGPLLGSSAGARLGLDWVTTAVACAVVACAAAVGAMGAAPDAVQRRLLL